MKILDFINDSGSLSVENFVLSNSSSSDIPVNNLSSDERPIFMSEFIQRLLNRGWNIPIRRVVRTIVSLPPDNPWDDEIIVRAVRPMYTKTTLLGVVSGFCDDSSDVDVTKGVYKAPDSNSGKNVVLLQDKVVISPEQVTNFTENYYKGVLKMKENDGITLYSSSKVVVDFLNNSITVDLIADDEYTNTISLVNVEKKLAKKNLSAKIDLTVNYTKNGELFGQDLTFEAFRYSGASNNIVANRNNFISYVNNEVVVEYIDGIIRVIPDSSNIDECIINNCVLTYGCI
jgi:hypothetical protein